VSAKRGGAECAATLRTGLSGSQHESHCSAIQGFALGGVR
jgi:hypothetical protein